MTHNPYPVAAGSAEGSPGGGPAAAQRSDGLDTGAAPGSSGAARDEFAEPDDELGASVHVQQQYQAAPQQQQQYQAPQAHAGVGAPAAHAALAARAAQGGFHDSDLGEEDLGPDDY